MLTNSFCALANLNISPGPNTKILTYMSYGIPCIASKTVMNSFHTNSSNLVQVYKNDSELIKLIFKMKNNKKFSENISKKSLVYIKKFKWANVLKKLKKL